MFSIQIVASAIFLRYFRFGPLEWLWRSLTHGRVERFRESLADSQSVYTP